MSHRCVQLWRPAASRFTVLGSRSTLTRTTSLSVFSRPSVRSYAKDGKKEKGKGSKGGDKGGKGGDKGGKEKKPAEGKGKKGGEED